MKVLEERGERGRVGQKSHVFLSGFLVDGSKDREGKKMQKTGKIIF